MIKLAKPFFNREIPPACAYCLHGHKSEYTEEIFCVKRGVTAPTDSCRSFKYDVLKRTTRKTAPAGEFSSKDFEL